MGNIITALIITGLIAIGISLMVSVVIWMLPILLLIALYFVVHMIIKVWGGLKGS